MRLNRNQSSLGWMNVIVGFGHAGKKLGDCFPLKYTGAQAGGGYRPAEVLEPHRSLQVLSPEPPYSSCRLSGF
jgi:hypothetical protein